MAVIDRVLAPDSPFTRRFFFLAKRFVAGDTVESALAAVRQLNSDGLTATLDYLGEDVQLHREAQRTRDVYLELLAAIGDSGLRTNVSVKLTALGLLISEPLAAQNLTEIVQRAAPLADPFVRIDMEGSALTDATLRVFERVYNTERNVGPVLQAYLFRTPADVERTIALGARVRLCKGAYNEPPQIAYRDMATIRREYLRLAEALLSRGQYPGIATHDERLITAVKTYAREQHIGPERFEFQMLYGVRPHRQRSLVDEGYNVRVYVPFGTHWAGYFYRRIVERKENALFALGSLVRR
ncbi:MAG: proline dehydrogenase family protein [Candidatus Eremiobacteraeota bacterium]|nr:proline dehydrogenase family protein [Candidatus Eremiobacteraeota bacterium]